MDEVLSIPGDSKILDTLVAYKASILTQGKVLFYTSPGFQNEVSSRAKHPSMILMDINTPRSERLHHLGTFMPQGDNMKGLLQKGTVLNICEGGNIILPNNFGTLMQREVSRDRIILLMRQGGKVKDGIAIQFPELKQL